MIRNESKRFSESDTDTLIAGRTGMPLMTKQVEQKIEQDQAYYRQIRERNFQLSFEAATTNNNNLEFEQAITNLLQAENEQLYQDKVAKMALHLPCPLSFIPSKSALQEALDLIIRTAADANTNWAALKDKIQHLPEENLFLALEDWLQQLGGHYHEILVLAVPTALLSI